MKIKILQRLRHGILGHGTLKTPSCSFFVGHLLLRVICFPRETASWQTTNFSFSGSYSVEIAYGLGLGSVSTSAFSSRTPSTADLYRPWACCPSLCEFLLWLGLVSLVLSISPGSYTLCLLFWGSWAPRGGIWSCLGLSIRTFHSEYCLAEGLCICSHLIWKKASLWWLSIQRIMNIA